MKNSEINFVFERLSSFIKNPQIELDHTNAYTLLIAVVLSAQSTDKGVNKATKELFKIVQNPEDMIKLGEEGLKLYIKTIGLYNAKARNILALSKMLIERFNGNVPNNYEDLKSLPGVGRKSANVILSCIFGQETIAVDTHVFRVSNRIGMVKANNVLKTEIELMKVVPKKWLKIAHHLLVLHGRYTCKAKKPECKKCVIFDVCKYIAKAL